MIDGGCEVCGKHHGSRAVAIATGNCRPPDYRPTIGPRTLAVLRGPRQPFPAGSPEAEEVKALAGGDRGLRLVWTHWIRLANAADEDARGRA